ncbi:MAG: hypothetical protein U9N34_02330 [Candidatus Cloacimonadota bacterium]|nr:hypothetical protein [Candidatus Cloacimonadota bacterium]
MKHILVIVLAIFCINIFGAAEIIEGYKKKDFLPAKNIDHIIKGKNKIGPISSKTSEEKLKEIFGKNNVFDSNIQLTNESKESSKVVIGKEDQLDVIWKTSNHKIPWKVIFHKNKNWFTEEGIRVGVSIAELEKINGASFSLVVDSKNYTISSDSWGQGEICENISLFFTFEDGYSLDAQSLFNHDQEILSNSKIIDADALVVETIIIKFEE